MRRLLVLAALAFAPAALSAQTITATIPDSIAVGARATVKLEARDPLGRIVPKPRGRVFLTCDKPAIVSAAVDRLTAHNVGATACRAVWDRSDYARLEVSHLVTVYAPLVVPTPVPVAITLAPATALALTVGDSARITVTGVTLAVGDARRAATAAELAAYTVRWSASGTAATVSDGVVRAASPGLSLVTACVEDACAVRGVSVTAPAPLVTRWVGMEPTATPCTRTLVAGEMVELTADTARFVRPLNGLPAWLYCVADSLAVTLEGDLMTPGDTSTAAPTYLTFAAGAALPTVWPAVIQPDTTIRPESLRIVYADSVASADGVSGSKIALGGLLGAGAVVSLLLGVNAAARRGSDSNA